MTRTLSPSNASFLFSAGSLVVALVSTTLGRRVNYLDYLTLFNVMAATMLALGVLGLAAGAIAAWKSRGRGATTWLAVGIATLIVAMFLLDG